MFFRSLHTVTSAARRIGVSAIFVAAAMAGCGGGGGADGGSGSVQGFDVRALWASYAAGGRTTVMTGVGYNDNTLVDRDQFEFTFVYTAAVSEPFPVTGTAARKMTRTGSYTAASQGGASTLQTEELFVDAADVVLGFRSRFPNTVLAEGCLRAESTTSLPTSATPPASGEVATFSTHSPCSPAAGSAVATQQLRWRLTREEGVNLFCLAGGIIGGGGGEFCYEAAADNTIGPRARFFTPLVGSTTTLTVRNYTPL